MKKLVLSAAVAVLLGVVGCASKEDAPEQPPAAAAQPLAEGDVVPGAVVVDFKDGTSADDFNAWEKEWGIDLELNSPEAKEEAITVAVGVADVDAVLARIRQNPMVEVAEPLMLVSIPPASLDFVSPNTATEEPAAKGEFAPNDPEYPKQWNMKLIGMPKAWNESHGKGVIVAVLDTGIAYEDHDGLTQVPDLKGAKFKKGYDFVNDDEHAGDDHGHGTHVAGTIAQVTNNGEGVAGIAFEATLMPVKVLNHFGSGTTSDIADAIRFAADNGAKVINMSLGGGGRSDVMANAVKYAREKGVTVICAAGNSGQPRVEYPAAYDGCVAVSAVGPSGKLAPYSSYGKELDIAGPGGDKRSGNEGGVLQNTIDPRDPAKSVYASYQGTSMATPHVAGVAALLIAEGASTPDEVEKALYAGATPVGDKAWSEQYGHGLLNAERSLASLGGGTGGAINWRPLAWAAGLLVLVLLTLGKKQRPALFAILFRPSFALPLVLATVGFFLIRWVGGWLGMAGNDAVELSSLPLPDWQKIIFGRGKLANPLFYSAAIPLVLSFLAINWKGLRPAVGGLAMGFAGFLAYSAWAKAPGLAYLPFSFLAMPWLVVNTVLCLFIARAMLRKDG